MTIMSLITKGYGTILAVVVFKFDEGGVPKQKPSFECRRIWNFDTARATLPLLEELEENRQRNQSSGRWSNEERAVWVKKALT
jgi:hypothetical protein